MKSRNSLKVKSAIIDLFFNSDSFTFWEHKRRTKKFRTTKDSSNSIYRIAQLIFTLNEKRLQ